jgi:hypothetical protein
MKKTSLSCGSEGVQRDVVCYYFAILAHLETLKIPAEQRFERRVSQWYDFAALHKNNFKAT